MPSPQDASAHVVRHAFATVLLLAAPLSQVSPTSTTPLPHSRWQVALQPSPAVWLPSSHCSPVSVTPSPHDATTQLVRHAFAPVLLLAAPLSQVSPASMTPLPHSR